MQLSRNTLSDINPQIVAIPADSLFSLPEKVLQFGTGVLLRGLPDYFIDKANKENIFNGRIVVVKSTQKGDTDAFAGQDGLYTLLERGLAGGQKVDKTIINAAISRVISAHDDWEAVLQCAANPAMQVIISNTTEVGIALVEPDAYTDKPVSFPGKLLLFLLARFEAFKGTEASGMVIIPTELIVDNGHKLKNILTTLARLKGTPAAFLHWLDTANDFCNSLVDCIVPGKLSHAEQVIVDRQLGYEDQLMIMSEPYRLWAIETKSERTRSVLSFSQCNTGVVLAPDINKFRELKLRLLNGTHILSCGLAYLSGFETVKAAMQDETFAAFVSQLMLQEIVPLVAQNTISTEEATLFALQVIDRFKNPFINHLWINITVQYTSKITMRTVPLLEKYYTLYQQAPELMALGYAAFILFMRSEKKADNSYYGNYQGKNYPVQDDKAAEISAAWQNSPADTVVENILQNTAIFGADLTVYPGFADAVNGYLALLTAQGVESTLHTVLAKKITV